MWEQYFFQDKGLFLQSLHPVAGLTYLAVLMVLALVFTHPFYLLGLLLVILLDLRAVDGLRAWVTYFKMSLALMVLIMIVNPLLTRAGASVIWQGPELPVLGPLTVSLEAVAYSAVMGIRLLDVVSIFCLYNLMVHPDQVLQIWARLASKSALVLSLATRMFPSMVRRLEIIREVQALRGVDLHTGRWSARLPKYAILLNVLLLSSLEDSLDMAEAMQARGFGSGRRSRYWRDIWRLRDIFCLVGSLLGSILAVYGRVKGYGSFLFYPHLDTLLPDPGNSVLLAAMLAALATPVFLSWGWRYCTCIRVKI